ncbi:MAG: hypothetical protein GWN84_05230 [Gammaproteobacteria bacterium]|nr:hypothetical protein [Gammaproteobacteria bacterium]NIR82364.1 hypothetical protein [Gammaproteobacteria bacterium]NIU03509.1 hypothetical protein [Gammaproteobacteria bacterium]NIX84783.1 hypothetical protein [Gammaproteobacteria bacterium]
MPDYEWVTNDMFDGALEALVDGMSAGELLAIPGVAEVLREALNNDVLRHLENAREDSGDGDDA